MVVVARLNESMFLSMAAKTGPLLSYTTVRGHSSTSSPLPAEVKEKFMRGVTAELDITSKKFDSAFNVQPERMDPFWNPRGIAINHWYHVETCGQFDHSWRMEDLPRTQL